MGSESIAHEGDRNKKKNYKTINEKWTKYEINYLYFKWEP